jgi:GTP-binding protein EngB required for normal cell division
VQARREREVRSRQEQYTVSLVGYTNAGKSTLMNKLTGAGVLAEDKLFSTLETRTRQWNIPDFDRVLLSDTVGFIRNLPHHLVASFKATLEETRQARLLLHVVDASSLVAEECIGAVNSVLGDIGCKGKPTLLVLNKVDRVTDRSYLHVLMAQHPKSVCISAATGEGLDDLRDAVVEALSANFINAEIIAPISNGKVPAYLNAHAEVYRQQYCGDEVLLRCYVPRHLLHHIQGPGVRGAAARCPAPAIGRANCRRFMNHANYEVVVIGAGGSRADGRHPRRRARPPRAVAGEEPQAGRQNPDVRRHPLQHHPRLRQPGHRRSLRQAGPLPARAAGCPGRAGGDRVFPGRGRRGQDRTDRQDLPRLRPGLGRTQRAAGAAASQRGHAGPEPNRSWPWPAIRPAAASACRRPPAP